MLRHKHVRLVLLNRPSSGLGEPEGAPGGQRDHGFCEGRPGSPTKLALRQTPCRMASLRGASEGRRLTDRAGCFCVAWSFRFGIDVTFEEV
jgi:hypothetical protein